MRKRCLNGEVELSAQEFIGDLGETGLEQIVRLSRHFVLLAKSFTRMMVVPSVL
jgi:hypothetical protein